MVWRAEDPQGNESAKVRFDVVPYMRGRVLDLGCGRDKVYPTAIGIDNRVDAKLFGIDIRPDLAVDTCERLDFFADGAADTVFSSHLLEHIEDYKGALREWWRLVKPGGHLVLYLPHRDHYPRMGTPGANPDHKHDYHPDDITRAMTDRALQGSGGWDQLENETRSAGMEYSFLQVYRKREDGEAHRFAPRERPDKTLGIVRLGAYGDALWASSIFPHFKREGYHITLYAHPETEEALRHDPNIDRFIVQPKGLFDFGDGRVAMWQTAYWLHEEKKYDRFINTIGGVERKLLPASFDPDFYLPFEQRKRVMNRNYVEALATWVGVPYVPRAIKFHPSAEELTWAATERGKIDGPLVLINPAGSSMPKWWPYAQELADALSAEGVHSMIVGDLRFTKFRETRRTKVIGTSWPMRTVMTLAAFADAVVGTESALVNSVAFEPPLKVVLLSHSTHENLTRDWHNTVAIEPEGLPCYPCHRIHSDMTHCTVDREAGASACQAAAKADLVLQHIMEYLTRSKERAA